jgi:hypothetical protein
MEIEMKALPLRSGARNKPTLVRMELMMIAVLRVFLEINILVI